MHHLKSIEIIAKVYCFLLIAFSLLRFVFLLDLPLSVIQGILTLDTSLSVMKWWLPGALSVFLLFDALALLFFVGYFRLRADPNASLRDLIIWGTVTTLIVGFLLLELFIPPIYIIDVPNP